MINLSIYELLDRARESLKIGNFEESRKWSKQALFIESANNQAKELLAYCEHGLGNKSEAMKLYKELILNPACSISILYEYGSVLIESGLQFDAIMQLERALKLAPTSFEILHDLATAYALAGKNKEAIEKYRLASQINPNSSELFYNLGCLHDEVAEISMANECYRRSISLDSYPVESLINLGINQIRMGNPIEGQSILQEALKINPEANFIYGDLKHSKMNVSDWAFHESELNQIIEGIQKGKKIIHPFMLLSLIDDPELQRTAAETYAKSRVTHQNSNSAKGSIKGKIRVGYFSSDFRNHAVSNLTAELFELHNKEVFEIYAFSSGRHHDDGMTTRLKLAFDEFIDISSLTDEQVVSLAKDKGINIAIDLGGYTENARIGVFERRVAPIQVSYLGYLGTLGSSHMDYLLADHEVISADTEKFYREKIIYLPNSFQVNDRKKKASERTFTRQELGLPEKGFVFCCFNNNYKLTPSMFSSWCRILNRVDESVLYLFSGNESVAENLRREACKRNVDPNRLIFGRLLPYPEYLARYKVLDLFLDTFPYNAGTTASDALWMGLPMITLRGKSFQSRMASSLLKAMNLSRLITNTVTEYEDLAVTLATQADLLKNIRAELEYIKVQGPLFNTPQTTRQIENAYQKIWNLYLQGQPPKNIEIS
jgi:predicted O-linked N-acetylglucosamine transferase (SPINDLY family)